MNKDLNTMLIEKQLKAQKLLVEINELADKSELADMTLDEINKEILDYRDGK